MIFDIRPYVRPPYQVFCWRHKGHTHYIAVDAVRAWLEQTEVPAHAVPFPADYHETLRIANDVDIKRALALPAAAMLNPAICSATLAGPGTLAIGVIDGSHRLWRALSETPLDKNGCRVVGAYVVQDDLLIEAFSIPPGMLEELGLVVVTEADYDPNAHAVRVREHFAKLDGSIASAGLQPPPTAG